MCYPRMKKKRKTLKRVRRVRHSQVAEMSVVTYKVFSNLHNEREVSKRGYNGKYLFAAVWSNSVRIHDLQIPPKSPII